MITSLSIKNYALIEQIQINLESGFTVITGETGAGKSILIDAFNLVLGERATAESVRTGSDKAFVEINVDARKLKLNDFFTQNEIDKSDELILRREISSKGQTRCFINDSPVTLSVLKELGDLLVDLHGQHDHQLLLKQNTHLSFVDTFSENENLIEDYKKNYKELNYLLSQKKEFIQKQHDLLEKKNLYEFQIKEIDTLNPSLTEEDELNSELNLFSNSEKLHQITDNINSFLYENEQSASSLLHQTKKQIEALEQIDPLIASEFKEVENAFAIVNELASIARKYQQKLQFSPERLEEIRTRLANFSALKKKYSKPISEILIYREKIGEEIKLLQNFDSEIELINNKIKSTHNKTTTSAINLSESRKSFSKKIEKQVVQTLADIGIANCKFVVNNFYQEADSILENDLSIKISNKFVQLKLTGIDNIEFFISTNIGEEPKPLNKVASGGEISRIMLALKSILANGDNVPLLIFDEIDVGVSGRVAQSVGKKLRELSKSHQVIAITHLPQIASLANTHYVVEKFSNKLTTTSKIKKLNEDERIYEVAKLMSGEKISDSSLETARALIEAN
ncbi:MAG: DNA repair protein RecN [Bacteroidetes bacterium]|nr:DNA repair protein RecN [Bacteroidota bacterium]